MKVREILKSGWRGAVSLFGGPGAGKTTALAHLAAVLSPDVPVTLLDLNGPSNSLQIPSDRVLIFTSRQRVVPPSPIIDLEVAPWEEDDRIEYLAATHRERVPSVLRRLRDAREPLDIERLEGLPELWQIVLDVMAADESIADVQAALLWRLGLELPKAADRTRAGELCIDALIVGQPEAVFGPDDPLRLRAGRLLRHEAVQVPLAAETLVDQFARGTGQQYLRHRSFSPELLERVGVVGKRDPRVSEYLADRVEGKSRDVHAMAASILHAMRIDWRPREGTSPDLTDASLANAPWAGVCLCGVEFKRADLKRANLSQAVLPQLTAEWTDMSSAILDEAWLVGGNFCEAKLDAATFRGATARECKFVGASLERTDFSHANLRRSRFALAKLRRTTFRDADMRRATLDRCDVERADFRRADLRRASLVRLDMREADFTKANFRKARLSRCNLEGLELPGADFQAASLRNCLLTGSFMPGANFHGALLKGAGLAEVDWPGVNLRNADLTGSSFHLGSSRSGLVGSTIAGEGSRTRFYTDESLEQDFKSPEEIRKANLCGADLRGATIDGVDFYLVDLRGARYTKHQAAHLRRCGAILSCRC
jgi:uncharacterized protein YjbI with pentapeptide repeats